MASITSKTTTAGHLNLEKEQIDIGLIFEWAKASLPFGTP